MPRMGNDRIRVLAAGTAKLVGTEPSVILSETCRLLNEPEAYARMSRAHNPYGDGSASKRIADILSGTV
ncbi:MAG: UDP-N-acetylglucosamine 2-epimerase [Porphyrobacter sp.]|nr:UDP-N-acetylglucosamine 2-epimerase [Porphyrobacter sp.]